VPRMLAVLLSAALLCLPAPAIAESLPTRISDQEFWRMISDFSEPGGYFPFENFVSNEDAFVSVIPGLQKNAAGGVYVGVGPEQNFTYISSLHPEIAFILDIRRQNMLEHLLYKAVFELSSNRVDFLARLFSRGKPSGFSSQATVDELFERFGAVAPSPVEFDRNVQEAIRYMRGRGFALSDDDEKTITRVYQVFYKGGPDLDYYGAGTAIRPKAGNEDIMPAFSDLMVMKDQFGKQHSFLASDENFEFVRDMHQRNLIVPLVGDFAGPKAIRAIGSYLKRFDTNVSVFYVSNVEQYLFEQPDAWKRFYTSVATLPLDASSTFVRANTTGKFSIYQPPGIVGRWLSLTSPIVGLLNSFNRGLIRNYYDVFAMSK
jgi:hypothetical protein